DDAGVVSYAYDKTGNVRFTQNDQQYADKKVTFYQYDDARRLTAVGEATFASAPCCYDLRSQVNVPYNPDPENNRLTDILNPDALAVSSVPNTILTANPTIWMTP